MMTATMPVTGAALAEAVGPEAQARLLGLPRDRIHDPDIAERAAAARAWYARHGRPFVAWRRESVAEVAAPHVRLGNDVSLRGRALAERLGSTGAQAFVAVAASAGPEVAAEADRHWREERPDEAYFLDRFGAAVAEGLVRAASGFLADALVPGEILLPHLSPGCGGWDLADQHVLWRLLFGDGACPERPVRILDSGGLDPRHSVLAGFGVALRGAEVD